MNGPGFAAPGRNRFILPILGAPGAGKTVLARAILQRYRRLYPRSQVIVCDPNRSWSKAEGGEWVSGADEDPSLLYPWIRRITNNGDGPGQNSRVTRDGALLLLDDADGYLVNTNQANPWRCVWQRNRHLRLDLIATAHRPAGLPKDLIAAASELFLFRMDEPNALNYFAKIPAIGEIAGKLPSRDGECLHVSLNPRFVQTINVFNKAA